MHDPFTDDALCPAVASTGAGLHKVTGKTVMWSRFGRVQVAFLPWKRYHAAAMASVRSTAGFKPSKFLRCSPPLPSLQKRSMNFLPLHQSSSGSNLTKMPSLQHDGSDWAFRMVIEDKYKRLVVVKKTLRRLTQLQALFVLLRTTWQMLPVLLAGTMLSNITLGIFGLGMFLPLLYMYAFGFGKPHRERLWAIKLHGIGVMVLLAEVVLTFYQYHVMLPKEDLIPSVLASNLKQGAMGLGPGTIKLIAQVSEGALDVGGIIVLVLLVLANKDYVTSKRDGEAKRMA